MMTKDPYKTLYLGLKFSLAYFSILPIRLQPGDNLDRPEILRGMLVFFPLVGILLGLVSIGIYLALLPLGWYGALIASAGYMAGYGFLHTEAVVDVVDALYGAHGGKDPYVIIKEPTVGAMGMMWGMGLVLLKISGIVWLLTHRFFIEWIAVVMLSRMVLLALFYTQTFRSAFLTQLRTAWSPKWFWGSMGAYGLFGMIVMGWIWILLGLVGFGIAWGMVHFLRHHLGFVNGDVMGTILEGMETILPAVIACVWEATR